MFHVSSINEKYFEVKSDPSAYMDRATSCFLILFFKTCYLADYTVIWM